MEKKIYVAPQMVIVKTELTAGLLSASNPNVTLNAGEEINVLDTHTDNGWDIWGNEEEYDEDYDY